MPIDKKSALYQNLVRQYGRNAPRVWFAMEAQGKIPKKVVSVKTHPRKGRIVKNHSRRV